MVSENGEIRRVSLECPENICNHLVANCNVNSCVIFHGNLAKFSAIAERKYSSSKTSANCLNTSTNISKPSEDEI